MNEHRRIATKAVTSRLERLKQYYPTIHLFGDWYLIRKYSKKYRPKFSIWYLRKITDEED